MSSPASLRLKKSNAVWLGVCSGIAEWLDMPAALVRVLFVISVLFWPAMFFGYFVMYFCMDREVFRPRTWDNLDPSRASQHFRDLNYRKPLYRNTRDKRLAGVCAGIADYLEVSAFWIRLLTFLSLFVFGPVSVFVYIACIFLLDPDPFLEEERRQRRQHRKQRRRERPEPNQPPPDQASRRGKAEAKGTSGNDCVDTFRDLEKRLREIESYMTSKRFRLHCEIKRA